MMKMADELKVMKMTEAQKKALDWLPSDGSWRMKPGRLAATLNSLKLYWSGYVECEWGNFGLRGGLGWRWRLTDKGVGLKKAVLQGE